MQEHCASSVRSHAMLLTLASGFSKRLKPLQCEHICLQCMLGRGSSTSQRKAEGPLGFSMDTARPVSQKLAAKSTASQPSCKNTCEETVNEVQRLKQSRAFLSVVLYSPATSKAEGSCICNFKCKSMWRKPPQGCHMKTGPPVEMWRQFVCAWCVSSQACDNWGTGRTGEDVQSAGLVGRQSSPTVHFSSCTRALKLCGPRWEAAAAEGTQHGWVVDFPTLYSRLWQKTLGRVDSKELIRLVPLWAAPHPGFKQLCWLDGGSHTGLHSCQSNWTFFVYFLLRRKHVGTVVLYSSGFRMCRLFLLLCVVFVPQLPSLSTAIEMLLFCSSPAVSFHQFKLSRFFGTKFFLLFCFWIPFRKMGLGCHILVALQKPRLYGNPVYKISAHSRNDGFMWGLACND